MHALELVSAATTATLLWCVGGCAPPADSIGEEASAEIVENGVHLNGLHLNGLHLNGLHLNGLHLNGLHLNGVELTGGAIVGSLPAGGTVEGAALVGTEMAATLSDGSPITLRINAVAPGAEPDVELYTVSYRTPPDTTPSQPLCGVDASNTPIQAIPLQGTWDESSGTPTGGAHTSNGDEFTFACEGYALAKCVEFGYAPWHSVSECRSPGDCHTLGLADFHQACTRMLRADYCGDGTSSTRDGTQVDLWDAQGIQTDDAPDWTFEAEWGKDGAGCVMSTRWPTFQGGNVSVPGYIQAHCASRWQPAGCGGAGSTFFPTNGFNTPTATRSLLRTRVTAN